jgi:DNA-binding CsgD family transcriptional regulator
MLYGRDAECGVIDDLVVDACRGRSGSLVLAGEAGIGKTALLEYAAELARDAQILQVHGVEAESGMPFAGLHVLVYPVRHHLSSLSRPQRDALGAALGLTSGEAPSRFLVAAGVVELLATLAEEQPVLCLVDDAQWLDQQSLGSLTFAQRRLRGDRIAMIFALRTGSLARSNHAVHLLADLPQLGLGPLDDSASERLLSQRADLDRSARTAVKAAAHGNPLALTVLAADEPPDRKREFSRLDARLQADYLRRVEGLGNKVRHLLLLAAADDTGDIAVVFAAARLRGATESHVAIAEERGLLHVDAGTITFTHPLVRSAVYGGASSAARREVHLALADALNGVDSARATWHRAAAAIPPAEGVAAQLADLGTAAVRRADTDLAARAFSRAAELTHDLQRRVGWLLDAAEAAWESGQVSRANHLVTEARHSASSESEPGRVDQLRGRLEAWTGSAVQGYEILLASSGRILDLAPERAAAMLFDALRAASVAGDMDRVVRAGRMAATLTTRPGHPPSAVFTAGIAELLTGAGAGAVASLRAGIDAVAQTDDPDLLYMAAAAAAYTGDLPTTHLLASRAMTRSRETGALRTLAQALEALAITQLDVSPRQAEANADEGLRAARETNQAASAAIHLTTLAWVAAVRGDRAATEDLAGQVSDLDQAHGLGYPAARAVAARGLLELGLGRAEQALVLYQSLVVGGGHRAAQLAAVDFTMLAAIWSGHRDQARDLLAAVGSWPWLQEAYAPWAEATLDRWRALLADGDTATALYERSLSRQNGSPRSFMLALTHLLLGEHLRRVRQRSAARPHLRLALEIFERFDAVPWAARARTELRATGETVQRHDDSPRLTPQELQVAQLVATGASTKRVAAQLYLSPRTVDSHLRQIFIKLGISSRAELRDVDLTG